MLFEFGTFVSVAAAYGVYTFLNEHGSTRKPFRAYDPELHSGDPSAPKWSPYHRTGHGHSTAQYREQFLHRERTPYALYHKRPAGARIHPSVGHYYERPEMGHYDTNFSSGLGA